MVGDPRLDMILAIIVATVGSSGLWQFVTRKWELNHSQLGNFEELLVSIGHDRIIYLTRKSLNDGYITPWELDNLEKLYASYHKAGGNGSATTMVNAVRKLPMCDDEYEDCGSKYHHVPACDDCAKKVVDNHEKSQHFNSF